MPDLLIRPAKSTDRPLLERLWLLFRHDMSEFNGRLPNPDGTFRSEWLESATTDKTWAAYLAFTGDHADQPIGFAFVRGLDQPAQVLNSFFIVRGARQSGYGTRFAHHVLAAHPGPWEIAFQGANAKGAKFWRRLAAEIAPDTWREEERPAPRPDLPPNIWLILPQQM